jgi:hypothetical protein
MCLCVLPVSVCAVCGRSVPPPRPRVSCVRDSLCAPHLFRILAQRHLCVITQYLAVPLFPTSPQNCKAVCVNTHVTALQQPPRPGSHHQSARARPTRVRRPPPHAR